jgi:sugar O-acyltransferase (sialic acid O-acetyltransferase NeuD family)
MPEKIVVFGAGGHAKVVIDAIERGGEYEITFLADENYALIGTTFMGYAIRSEQEGFAANGQGITHAFVAIGDNAIRKRIALMAQDCGFVLAKVVHPAAIVSGSALLGVGTLAMPGSIINADARVGSNVIINTGAIVDHDCRVGDDAHIAPRATLCGGVQVGTVSLIGAGAIILPGVSVGAGATVGAGSLVLSDVPDGAVAIGVPARAL